ncbi:GNAT family N-acetyltransferase [Thermococcus thioreducens]|uniref:GNAT family acetyltransferase n=1 Tax=Thermococcus thioreducens TaxID=277988 RepID=A0A0Q2S5J4_9EURY|nr:GNAT family N-acetyltransferase [Thermococcus thioreducens]ASJ12076.1 GNAT family acetyltransferase [Thermococcus thioreducens]KQH82707.1 GNAT family acetyltransferase [Thermococcus thioreducens]SEW08848.1 Ribosomal protein S18 acetylase RimI [Thermococcus thioreducens]
MRIRLATLDDVGGIVALHTANERLSGNLYERYTRGGPWMSVETCAIHLNNLLLDDQLVAVAELKGIIVGEVEVLFSEEPVGGRLRKIGHVDVIEVHPDYRGRGIGRLLMEFVGEVAKERKVEMLTVQPDEDAEGFYRKLGFDAELFTGTTVWVPARGRGTVEPSAFGWEDVKNLELVAGRFQSSYSMFFSAFKDNIAGIHYTIESGRSGGSYYALKSLPGREGAALLLWGRIWDLKAVLGRAKVLGFERVLTLLPGDVESFGAEKVGKIKILAKELT